MTNKLQTAASTEIKRRKTEMEETLMTLLFEPIPQTTIKSHDYPEYDLFQDWGLPIYESETNAQITSFYQRNPAEVK